MSEAISFSTRFCALVGWNGKIFLIASRTRSSSWNAIPVCAFCWRRRNSRPSSRKNSSSKMSRTCAGVRDDCRSVRLSPASGQCTFQSDSLGETRPMRARTAGGNRLGKVGRQVFESGANDAPKPARLSACLARPTRKWERCDRSRATQRLSRRRLRRLRWHRPEFQIAVGRSVVRRDDPHRPCRRARPVDRAENGREDRCR